MLQHKYDNEIATYLHGVIYSLKHFESKEQICDYQDRKGLRNSEEKI